MGPGAGAVPAPAPGGEEVTQKSNTLRQATFLA